MEAAGTATLSEGRALEFSTKLEFVSKNLEQLFHDMSILLNTTVKVRTRSMNLAEHVKSYSDGETPGLRSALSGLSESIRAIEDQRRVMYDRMVSKVYQPLNAYSAKCQEARGWKQQRDKAAKRDGAAEERERQDAVYVDRMRKFEEDKIVEVKSVFGNWVHSQMVFHAKSLELLTRAHQLIMLVDETPELAQSLRGVAPAPPAPTAPAPAPPGSPLRQQQSMRRTRRRPPLSGSATTEGDDYEDDPGN